MPSISNDIESKPEARTQPHTRSPLQATHDAFIAERPTGADEDVHMLAAVLDYAIETYSDPGDLVCDPFSGFGTTLQRALGLQRRALGIELLPERVEYVRERLPEATVLEGDAREMLRVIRPAISGDLDGSIDLIVTSPPYMTATHHEADLLTAYEHNTGDYRRYLTELGLVAAQCARLITPGGYVIWNVADIHHRGHTTRLISDGTAVLQRHLEAVATIAIMWDQYPHDLIADALLVFRRPPTAVLAEPTTRP